MAGAGGKEVGRLSIRVVPDMDGFRGEVERGANAAAASTNPKVNVGADTTKARDQIRVIEDEKYGAVVDLDADTKGVREKITAETRNLPDARVKVKADLDQSSFARARAQMDLLNIGFENRVKSALGRKDLLIEPIGELERRMGRMDLGWDKKVKDLQGAGLRDLEEQFKLKPHLDEASIEEMRLRLAHENFTAKVKVETDRANMERLARTTARDLERLLPGNGRRGGFLSNLLGDGASVFGGLGSAAGGLGSKIKGLDFLPNIGGLGGIPSILLIVAALSLVAPALALVSQAVVGLPALLAGVALPLGVFALGIGGIKKALEESGFMDVITGKKGKTKETIGAPLKEMQDRVSDVFEKGFTPLFRSVAGVLPQLTAGLPFVAKGIVDLAGGLTRAIINPQNVALFDRFTNSVSTMLTNLAPGLESFSTGMFKLITNVGDHLPGLGNTMTQWADQFNHWIDKVSKPQTDWFGRQIPNSSELDKAVQNIKPVLDTVKDFVGDLVGRGLKLAQDPKLIGGVKDFLTGLEHLIEQVSRLGPTFEALAKILSIIPTAPKDDKGNPAPPKVFGTEIPKVGGDPGFVPRDQRPEPPKDPNRGFIDKFMDWNAGLWGSLPKKVLDFFDDSNPDHFSKQPKNLQLMGIGGQPPSQQAPVPVQVVQAPNLAPLFPGVPGYQPPKQAPIPPQLQPQNIPGVQTAQPPKIEAPKIEPPKIPPGSEKIWEPLVQATHQAGSEIQGEVDGWAGKIKAALDSASAGANASGQAIGTQLAAGIRAGEGAAVEAAHHLADAVKGALPRSPAKHGPFSGAGWGEVKSSGGAIATQFADGLDGGYDGVVSSAQRLAQAVKEAMGEKGVLTPQLKQNVTQELAAIGIQYDKLKDQYDDLDPKTQKGERKGLKAQMDQLRELREDLGGDKKLSDYNRKYGGIGDGGDSFSEAAQMITSSLASGLDAIKGFAMANFTQLGSDLGMSGNGAVEQLANYGVGFLTSSLNSVAQAAFGGNGSGHTTNIYTSDLDGALKARDNDQRVRAMTHVGR